MKNLLIIVFIICSINIAFSQVGIGTINPEPSSILDINSTDKGLIMPRLSNFQRDAIVNPVDGLLVYNISTSNFNYFHETWKDFSPTYKSVNSSSKISTSSEI